MQPYTHVWYSYVVHFSRIHLDCEERKLYCIIEDYISNCRAENRVYRTHGQIGKISNYKRSRVYK